MESKANSPKSHRRIASLDFMNYHMVTAIGFKGGLWLMCKDMVQIVILKDNMHFIQWKVTLENEIKYNTFWHAPSYLDPRKKFWEDFIRLDVNKEWCTMEGFNEYD